MLLAGSDEFERLWSHANQAVCIQNRPADFIERGVFREGQLRDQHIDFGPGHLGQLPVSELAYDYRLGAR